MTCKPFTLFSTPDLWLVGQGLDVKSSFCPILVQAMSNICPNKGLLQGLSSRCLTLSNPGPIYDNLDRHWTKITVLVHSLSFGNHNLKSLTKSGQTCIFDHVWTRLGFFLTQRGSSSEVGSFPQTNSGQSFVFLVLSPANSKLQYSI